jgi:hypothetical protein
MNKFDDDIREYDPFFWINLKKSSPKVKVTKEIKKEVPIELTKHYKPEIKVPKEIIPKLSKEEINEKRRLNNKKNYESYGKQWYKDNKERLEELRKKRIVSQDSKDNKYFYNRQYYETNREELNRKRRIKDKERRDQKKLLS